MPLSFHRLSPVALLAVAAWAAARPARAQAAAEGSIQEPLRVAHVLDVDVGREFGVHHVRLLADEQRTAVRLEIAPAGGSSALQRLPVEAQAPPSDEALPQIVVEDLNGDGLRDLRVMSWAGATGNRGYLAWRFDANLRAYAAIPRFDELSRPEVEPGGACLRSHARGGAAGMIFTAQRWCWRGDRLELAWEQHQDIDADGAATRITRELRDGVMVEIERRVGVDPGYDELVQAASGSSAPAPRP